MIKVNLTTNTATREGLPQFLQGLKPESLQDLSWTDAQLGVQDNAWYPEVGVTPPFDSATHTYDGTETLTVNATNKTVEVTKGIREKTNEELLVELQAKAKEAENAIEEYINTTVKAKGYNSQDSIAKYLVSGNPFYAECTAISLWIGSVWVYSHQVQADVMAGTRTMPTIEELINELPKYGE